jgi:hypothetical protein
MLSSFLKTELKPEEGEEKGRGPIDSEVNTTLNVYYGYMY